MDAAEKVADMAPIDVDLRDDAFADIELAMDFPQDLQAQLLGAYLLALLDSYKIQKKINFPNNIALRADVITTLSDRRFWVDTMRPNLPPECWMAVADVADFMVAERDAFALTEEQCETLGRLSLIARRTILRGA